MKTRRGVTNQLDSDHHDGGHGPADASNESAHPVLRDERAVIATPGHLEGWVECDVDGDGRLAPLTTEGLLHQLTRSLIAVRHSSCPFLLVPNLGRSAVLGHRAVPSARLEYVRASQRTRSAPNPP